MSDRGASDNVHEEIRSWGDKLKDLARRLDEKADRVRAQSKDRMVDLEARMAKMRNRMQEAGSSAGREWQRLKDDLGKLRDDVEQAIKEVG